MKIIYVGSLGKPRLRERRIDEQAFAGRVAKEARAGNEWSISVINGGSVCNSYGYPASTECALAVSDPNGLAVCWLGRAPANKVTDRGAAEACLSGSGDIFDGRVTRQARIDAAYVFLKTEHARHYPPLTQLAEQA